MGSADRTDLGRGHGGSAQLPPGGAGDGLPTLPDGEPILHRWFVIAMLVLVAAVIGVGVVALTSTGRPRIDPAARRPPGDQVITHERGQVVLSDIESSEPGPGCATGITMVGDDAVRAATTAALRATCQLLEGGDFPTALDGLARWQRADGTLRLGIFELTGVDSTALLQSGGQRGGDVDSDTETDSDVRRLVIELNAKFQTVRAQRAAPAVVHELVHLSQGMPGRSVTADAEVAAIQAQARACGQLDFADTPPRGCRDARELLATDAPRQRLMAAGYPTDQTNTDQTTNDQTSADQESGS